MGDIVTLKEFKAYLGREILEDSEGEPALGIFLTAAQDMIRAECGLPGIPQNFDQRALTNEYHSGRKGQVHLFSNQRPVAVSPLPTLSENGTDLVVAAGYSSTAHVVFDPETGIFTRQPIGQVCAPPQPSDPCSCPSKQGLWAEGNNNIVLKTYTGGYAAASMPADLKLLIQYTAAFVMKQADRNEITMKRRSDQQGSTEFFDNLPPFYAGILARYKVSPYGK